MRKVLKYGLLFLLWGGVAAYVVYAASRAGAVRRALTVRDIAIEVRDSTAHGNLVSTPAVRGWIAGSGIPILGARAYEVDLRALERLIARNGFVDRVNAHVTYDGVLRVEVSQREPLLRLLVDGYDVYVTGRGYVFPAPRASSVYVPVVTGGYRPPFPAGYGGDLAASLRKELERSEEAIAGMEREKYPFFRRERRNDENIRALRRMTIRKGWFEADEKFDERVAALRRHKAELRRRYRYEEQCIEAGIQAIVKRQEAERARQKKLEKRYEDFWKLITFVKKVIRKMVCFYVACSAQRRFRRAFREAGAGRTQARPADDFLPGGVSACRLGCLAHRRCAVRRAGGLLELTNRVGLG